RDNAMRRRDFVHKIEQIEALIVAGKFGEAEEQISNSRDLSPPADEARQLDRMLERVRLARVQAETDAIISRALALRDAGDIAGAISFLDDEMLRHSAPELAEARDELATQQRYGQAMQQYRDARS